ncbi:hypothetical protein [Acidovorax sp.]
MLNFKAGFVPMRTGQYKAVPLPRVADGELVKWAKVIKTAG